MERSYNMGRIHDVNLGTTYFRKYVKAINSQLANPELSDLDERNRLVIKREAAYSAVKMIQAGCSQAELKQFAQSNGIAITRNSGKGLETTFNVSEFTEYGKRGCNVKQGNMSFKANRIGSVRVTENLSNRFTSRMSNAPKTVSDFQTGNQVSVRPVSVKATRKDTVRTFGNGKMLDFDKLEAGKLVISQTKTQGTHLASAIAQAETMLANVQNGHYANERVRKAQTTRWRNRLQSLGTIARDTSKVQGAIAGQVKQSEVSRFKVKL